MLKLKGIDGNVNLGVLVVLLRFFMVIEMLRRMLNCFIKIC